MSIRDLRDIRLDDATLVPRDDAPPSDAPRTGKAKFSANTRDAGDRRKGGERREQLRLQDDRRSGKDRRPRKGWEKGQNL